MWINRLQRKEFQELCSTLGRDSTIGWKKVMTEGFPSLYSQNDVKEIGMKNCPSEALLDDLYLRQVPLKDLVLALKLIDNKRALAIISKGMELEKIEANLEDCDSLPPPRTVSRKPEENSIPPSSYTPSIQSREQVGTLLPYSIQESTADDLHRWDPENETLIEKIISALFPCFEFKMYT